jgi:hypothetical protein
MARRWKWRRPSDEEPLDRLRIEFYLTREDYEGYLCASGVDTGTQLGDRELVAAVRDHLEAATLLEPDETWADNYSADEVAEREKWAAELVAAFYERTRR